MSKESQRYYDVCCGAQHAAKGDECGKRIEDYAPPLTDDEKSSYERIFKETKECLKNGDIIPQYYWPDID